MGINFSTAHPTDIYGEEDGRRVCSLIAEALGSQVPLGTRGQGFCLADEMGWSWWTELRHFARQALGTAAVPQLEAVDAWNGVYVDADVERCVLWPWGKPAADQPDIRVGQAHQVFPSDQSWFSRLLRRLGLKRVRSLPAGVEGAMRQMVVDYGPRPREQHALQVGSLRRLVVELDALLAAQGVERTASAVEGLRQSYVTDNDRVDSEPHIQCLCHAWLTAQQALATCSPMWLVK